MSAHVTRNPIGDPARLSTSRTFPTDKAAEREAAAWRSTGEWEARVVPGRAPRASCGRPYCTRLYDHAHGDPCSPVSQMTRRQRARWSEETARLARREAARDRKRSSR